MKYVATLDVPLDDILLGERLRQVDAGAVEALAESMAEIGQQTPVELVQYAAGQADYGRKSRAATAAPYRLVAGAHRYSAAKHLGWKTIRAEIKQAAPGDQPDLQVALREIDENLYRYGLKRPLDPLIDEIRAIVDGAASFAEIQAELTRRYAQLDRGALAEILAEALVLVELGGRDEIGGAGDAA